MTKRTKLHDSREPRGNEALRNRSGDLGEDLSEIATLAVDVGRDQLGKIRDAATQNYRDAKEQLVTWEDTLESYIRRRPIKSLLIAAGVGMVFSMIWRHR